MAHVTDVKNEIEDLERRLFGNPEGNSLEAAEAQPENLTEKQSEELQVTASEDTFDESGDTPTTQETDEDEYDETKPTRTNWKKMYTDLDKRFRNLKSSNDSTIFELRTNLAQSLKTSAEQASRIDELEHSLREVKNQTDVYEGLLTEEEQDIIGRETLDSLKKMNKVAIESAVTPLKEELERERKLRVETTKVAAEEQSKAAHKTFLSQLESLVEDYADYDVDPEFHQWMEYSDEFSGVPRKSLFKKAQSIGDVGRVAQFFIEFKKMKNAGVETLEERITPSTTSNNATAAKLKQTVPKKQYVSISKYEQFISDVSKGRYKGREKLVKEIQAQVDLAQKEGRLTA